MKLKDMGILPGKIEGCEEHNCTTCSCIKVHNNLIDLIGELEIAGLSEKELISFIMSSQVSELIRKVSRTDGTYLYAYDNAVVDLSKAICTRFPAPVQNVVSVDIEALAEILFKTRERKRNLDDWNLLSYHRKLYWIRLATALSQNSKLWIVVKEGK